MVGEVIQNRPPTTLLKFKRVFGLWVKGNNHFDLTRRFTEINIREAITKSVLQVLHRFDLCVNTSEVKTHRAILGLHARTEAAPNAKIDFSMWAVPIV